MPVKILIVDDSLTVRIVLKRLLRNVMEIPELQLSEATNGRDGLAMMRAQRPDLVLADLNMDGMTGVEMIELMRADPALASIPVAVISSEGNPGVTDALALNGVRAFIRKPFDLGSLSELLPKVLAGAAG
ncbi:MAG TPA: response regulator [bacterium]|jgi:CheY-like chemotaxis protein|nr:response regulator [bacterium]HXB96895.1 response regulator [bacterium]HXC64414.1 response regulator [bacterium]